MKNLFEKYSNLSDNSFMGKRFEKNNSFTYEQLINYYPKHYLLDELLTAHPNANHINFFFDLKNIMQTTYLEFAIRYLINDSVEKGRISSLIFESFIAFISFHKKYITSRNKTANYYVFFESGDSGYHKRFLNSYKGNRSIDKGFGLTEKELRLNRDILQKNFILIHKIGNKIPDVKVYHLKNLEADFIPYYLMSRELVPHGKSVINLTYSSDHDLYQNTLAIENSFIYYRKKQNITIFDKHKILSKYIKKNNVTIDLEPEYYPIFIACTGDTGDNIPTPFRGAGPVTVNKNLKEFVDICGGIENIYNKAKDKNCEKLLDLNTDSFENINLNKTIQKFIDNNEKILMNMRLMSFEVLSYFLDHYGDNTLMEQRQNIFETTFDKNTVDKQILVEALSKTNIYVEEKHLDGLFHSPAITNVDEFMKNF